MEIKHRCDLAWLEAVESGNDHRPREGQAGYVLRSRSSSGLTRSGKQLATGLKVGASYFPCIFWRYDPESFWLSRTYGCTVGP
ncbi:protein of unknown function (plasmid) [Cupriavidus taiwanensis]|uniref:Uncharacterized protein n=1 Tax=Cupriavidus taiwanensis TaxID=164546 RepID=A0A9Q7V3P5_9BURK|nr:protein of unknown function [Cupriavidus taiwanensis]